MVDDHADKCSVCAGRQHAIHCSIHSPPLCRAHCGEPHTLQFECMKNECILDAYTELPCL
jgi:hypothetical protein